MSNGIGQFRIGVDPVGIVTPPFDWTKTIYAQYANSPVLTALVEFFSNWLDPAQLIDFFYDNVWNIATATGWGLDVWGRIVGVNRVLQAAPSRYFGFQQAGTLSADPFDQSPFYSGLPAVQNYALSDDAFRTLILAKAAANIWDGSIPGLNRILRLLFPGQVCYVTDGANMTMTYYFGFVLSPVQQTIVINSGVLPRPAGVSASYVQL
jgi:hypothetical protein